MNPAAQRLAKLRQTMREHNLDAWIIPSADPHLSEYLPEHWQARVYFSGFTGSVGTLVVTADKAGLWADSRYWEQAAHQLQGSGIELQKVGEVAPYTDWLAAELPDGAAAGAAADMLSLTAKRQLETAFAAKNIRLDVSRDIADTVWADRPALPQETVFPHDAAFVSETAAAKLARVRAAMKKQGAAWHLISSLDDTAWLTNLRGSDVPYNPVFLSYLLIGTDSATLFVDEAKLNPASRALLAEAGIATAPYAAVREALAEISDGLLVNPDKTAVSTLQLMPSENRLIENINPSTLFKSVKSAADLDHVREAMRQDGAALCGFFAEFERNLADGTAMNELDIDTMLHKYRSARPNFVSLSFNTIAGYNANGALPHYAATPEAFSDITGSGLLLIDSGAQYLGGTTDITRVVPVGETTPEQKRDYTLVLKAHIALAETVFPENIAAPLLDAICRKPLWQEQCNYGHGTGHGVGYFMNVHEGPQVISYLAPVNPHHAMKAGMITSNEPGLYRPGRWGVRIENLVANQPVASPQETEFGKFLHFETLTLCPIDTRPIDLSLMTAEEIRWLNAYHADVREKLLPLVDGAARDWLLLRTEAV
ncbi:peptidase M24 [Neisseria elongata subsp. glycolytica ATCC 29315]|uniref:Peptidase M24 n=1 Tax=Neisseria elongata subsp. glycolytica ATCC 29315 TaxID=546263 RepID=A0A0B5CMG6_NEIEG|nr:aminopeptidase P family protein [Neisseria elongata]AJE17760.1 peptidase M24 [Neisseria elongata subsp. glycolytica ATCC 29315]SQH49603.1 aminopeptidase [Neisseria elongata subsp. glycolytica]